MKWSDGDERRTKRRSHELRGIADRSGLSQMQDDLGIPDTSTLLYSSMTDTTTQETEQEKPRD